MSVFKKAKRSSRKLKCAFDGVSGSGKSYTALRLAFGLVKVGMASKVAVIDTENESASLYEGEAPDGVPFDFDTLNMKKFGPQDFIDALTAAFKEGYDCVVIDSLSHAWIGKGGALDMVDAKGGNSFAAWKDITPLQRAMVDKIITAPAHVLCTMRSKVEYVMESDHRGKQVPKKVGMAPVQRDGLEYEFDIYGTIDAGGQLRVTKSRCPVLTGGTAMHAGFGFWSPLFDWMQSAPPAEPFVPAGEPLPPAAPTPDNPGLVRTLAASITAAADLIALADARNLVKDNAKKLSTADKEALKITFVARERDIKASGRPEAYEPEEAAADAPY